MDSVTWSSMRNPAAARCAPTECNTHSWLSDNRDFRTTGMRRVGHCFLPPLVPWAITGTVEQKTLTASALQPRQPRPIH